MKWSIWVIGNDGRGDPAGHWYKITPTSGVNSFNSKLNAIRHKIFLDEVARNFNRNCTYFAEEFKDEHTKPESRESNSVQLDRMPKVWKKEM